MYGFIYCTTNLVNGKKIQLISLITKKVDIFDSIAECYKFLVDNNLNYDKTYKTKRFCQRQLHDYVKNCSVFNNMIAKEMKE